MNSHKIFALILSLVLSSVMIFSYSYAEAAVNMSAGQDCLDLIKEVEGFSRYKYWDYSQWTIGYGTGVGADEYPDGITEEEAERLLKNAIVTYEDYVNEFAENYNIEFTQNQFDALVSLTYNMGNIWRVYDEFNLKNILIDGSEKHSFFEIAKAFGEWRVAGGSVLQGLVQRREKETKLFLSDRSDSNSEVLRVNDEGGINLRSDAGINNEKTGFLPMNTIYEITEKKLCDGSLWGKTVLNGTEHWCVLDYSEYIIGGPLDYSGGEITGKTEKWRITSDNGVNFRKGPGIAYDAIGVIGHNVELDITITIESDGHIWGKTNYNNKDGWIALTYAERISDQQFDTVFLESIYIASEPAKTEYSEGEALSLDGIDVRAVYSDGSEKSLTDFTAEGFESAPGKHTITISYMEKTASFTIRVLPKKLVSLEIASLPNKTVYKSGDALDTSGLIVNAIYDNNTKAEITNYKISGFDSNTAGIKNIMVEYEGLAVYFEVEVTHKNMTSLVITRLPDKREYKVGEPLDLSGIIVYAYFDNNSKVQTESFSVKGFNPETEGVQTLAVGYNGFYTTFTIRVKKTVSGLTGDLDANGVRDIFDLVLLNRLIGGESEDIPADRITLADMNGDGNYDVKDIEALSVIVSGQEG